MAYRPLFTEFWHFLVILAIAVSIMAVLHITARRRATRDEQPGDKET